MTGACGCGAVRFEIARPFTAALYCHCTRCQHRTGAGGGVTGRVEPGSVTIVSGAEHVRDWKPEGGMPKAFCVLCGSALFSRTPEEEIVGVRLGVVDGDPGVRPAFHQFTAYAATWEPLPDDGLPRYEERAPA
jgi:hypothetical protein